MDFYCELCRRWTAPERRQDEDEVIVPVRCSNCGEAYTCGDCGAEIDERGRCLRSEWDRDPGSPICPNDVNQPKEATR